MDGTGRDRDRTGKRKGDPGSLRKNINQEGGYGAEGISGNFTRGVCKVF